MTRASGVGIALLALALPACGRRVTEAECRELLDRYTILLLRGSDAELAADTLDRLRAEAQLRLRAAPAAARCGDRVSRRAFVCAQAAGTVDEIERCLL